MAQIIYDCVSLADKFGMSIDYLDNGWFYVGNRKNHLIYENLSDLHDDLNSGHIMDYFRDL